MIPVTFVDLETTGLDPEWNEIIELAAIKTQVGEGKVVIEGLYEAKVMPEFPVDPFIAKLNGFDYEQWVLSDLEELPVAVGNIFALMRDSWHAGSNPKFDASFLEKAAREFHWSYPKLASYHLLDISTMAFPLLIEGKVERLQQENIAESLGIPGGGHRAMADTKQCMEIFAKLNALQIVNS